MFKVFLVLVLSSLTISKGFAQTKSLPEEFFLKCDFIVGPTHLIKMNQTLKTAEMKMPDIENFVINVGEDEITLMKNKKEVSYSFNKWNGILSENTFRSKKCEVLDKNMTKLYE